MLLPPPARSGRGLRSDAVSLSIYIYIGLYKMLLQKRLFTRALSQAHTQKTGPGNKKG